MAAQQQKLYYEGTYTIVVHGKEQQAKRKLLNAETNRLHKSKIGKTRKVRDEIDEKICDMVIKYNENLNLSKNFDLHWTPVSGALKYAAKIMDISDGTVLFLTGKGKNADNGKVNIKEAMEEKFGGSTKISENWNLPSSSNIRALSVDQRHWGGSYLRPQDYISEEGPEDDSDSTEEVGADDSNNDDSDIDQ